ncbi:hypothetical protein SOVF_068930 [Spinacia oleracea]|nr:hypothetical protein SOVF_068930 [Spinacia oleracea]
MKNMVGCFVIIGLVMMSGVVDAAVFFPESKLSSSAANRFVQIWGNGEASRAANLKKFLSKFNKRTNQINDICDAIKKVRKQYSSEERSINIFPNYQAIVVFFSKYCRD